MNIPESRNGLLKCISLMKLMTDIIKMIIRLASAILSIFSYSTFSFSFKITLPSKTIVSSARNIMLMDFGKLNMNEHIMYAMIMINKNPVSCLFIISPPYHMVSVLIKGFP